MNETTLAQMGGQLREMAGQVADGLDKRHRLGNSVEGFTDQLDRLCHDLSRKIESLTMAKAGLEALLSGYQARFGGQAEEVEEFGQFRAMLAEKINELEEKKTSLTLRNGDIHQVMDHLNHLDVESGDGLADLEQIVFALKAVRLAERDRIAEGRNRVKSLAERFLPQAEAERKPARRLDRATLSRVVDRAVAGSAPDSEQRRQVLAQLLETVRDESIRSVVAERLADS